MLIEIPVLSVRQPWAWALLQPDPNGKNIENRSWPTKHRGPLGIHASGKVDQASIGEVAELSRRVLLPDDALRTSALLGVVNITDCVEKSRSRWFCGDYGFVRTDPRPLAKPIPMHGRLGIFKVRLETDDPILLAAFGPARRG